ncbi:MAG: SDR family oxidoreductase [Selenomonas bovis]|nr:SDR family oxidoreductase [Selenomonas bovis]
MRQTYLILGACGMAGHMLAAYLSEQGAEVVGFARHESPVCRIVLGDARDEARLRQVITEVHADVVINAIGVLNRAVDRHLANGIYLNSFLPHFAAECCDAVGSQFLHISTDCVFSGRRGGYVETDVPDETSWYGRTKALGEVVDGNHLTIRTSIIGPELNPQGVGLFHWFMQQRGSVAGYAQVAWSGVTTLELAKFIWRLRTEELTGLYHLTNNEKIAKRDLLKLFNAYRSHPVEIRSQEDPVSDKSLCSMREGLSGYAVPSYTQMVEEQAAWIAAHAALYPEYEVRV